MKKIIHKIAGLALGLSLAMGVGVALGGRKASEAKADETYSMTPNQSSTGSSATSYISTLTEFTYSGVTWKMNQWNPKTLQVKTNQSSASTEFRFYNTSAFGGRIKSVTLKFKALTLSNTSNTGFMFQGGSSEVNGTSGGTSGTWDSSDKTITWTPAANENYTYFGFYQNGKVATGSNYLSESDAIVVDYETSGETPTTYTVTFDSNGGSAVESISGIESGESISSPNDPSKANCLFAGWYTDEDYTEAYTFGIPVTESFTLYAKWTLDSAHAGTELDPYSVADARMAIDAGVGVTNVYATGYVSAIPTAYSSEYSNITFNLVDAKGDEVFLQAFRCGGDDAADVVIGDTAVVYGSLTKYGSTYEFGSGCTLVSLTHSEVEDTSTVTYNANGGTCEMESETILNGTHPSFPSASKDGYTFDGWKTSGDDTLYTSANASEYTLSADVEFVAQYTEIPSTDDYYEKITSMSDFEDGGKYLIVYESSGVAFDGSLDTFDAEENSVDVAIADNKIYTSETINAASFTISSMTGGYSFQGSSGNYFTVSSYKNALVTQSGEVANGLDFNNGNVQITRSFNDGTMTLKYNSASNQLRFRFYKSGQQEIQLYKYVETTTPPTPQPTETTIVSGTFEYNEKASLFVGDFGTMVVNAPEGYTVFYAVDEAGVIVCDDYEYNQLTGQGSCTYSVKEETAVDDVLTLYWFVDGTYNSSTMQEVEETLQVVNPEGLAGARAFAASISAVCSAAEKDFSTLEGSAAGLTEAAKDWLLDAEYEVSGSGDSTKVVKADGTHYEIAAAMSRYDFMVEHYGMNDFLNKGGLVQNAARVTVNNATTESSVIIIAVVALTSITSIGVLLVIKRKRSLVK